MSHLARAVAQPARDVRSVPVSIGQNVIPVGSQQTTTGTARVPYYLSVAATDLRLKYKNWYANGIADADNTAALVLAASVEYAGTIYPVTFAGAKTVTISPGGETLSDPLPLDLPADQLVYVRTYTSGSGWYPNRITSSTGGGGWTATTDLTAAGAAAIADATGFTNLLGPDAIYGLPTAVTRPPIVLGVGDSIMAGTGDGPNARQGVNTGSTNMGRGGFLSRALETVGGLYNIGCPSDTATNFLTPAGHFRRLSGASVCSTAVCNYGRNDISTGRTLTQLQADLIAIWTMLATNRKQRTFHTTITPISTSTDLWQTAGGQTPGNNESVRLALNAWLRDGAPMSGTTPAAVGTPGAARCAVYGARGALVSAGSGPAHLLYGIADVADAVETARNSGIWRDAGNLRAFADCATTASSIQITSTSAAWSTADKGRTIWIPGAGTAGALFSAVILSASGTTAFLSAAPPTTVSGASATIGDSYTQDGTHPQPPAAAAMATTLPVSAFV